MEYTKLITKLEKYEYISFDLFDTLMFRTVSKPESVFELMEWKYNQSHAEKLSQLKRVRIKSELAARKLNNEREITIDNIYEQMPYSQEINLELKELEKELEIAVCLPNNSMIDVVNWCRENGKYIIITTDMYLDRMTIKAILKKIGVLYNHLYISSEAGVTKVQGKLFPYVLEDLGISSDKMVHIGDNLISDLQMSRQCGIDSFERIQPAKSNDFYRIKDKGIGTEHLLQFIDRKYQMNEEKSAEFRIGYGVLGPVLMEFCRWLHKQKSDYGCEKLFFVAREGYLIQKVYEEMYPQERNDIAYIRLNKNLFRMAALHIKPTVSQFLDTIPMFDSYTFSEILDYMLVEDKEAFISKMTNKYELNGVFERQDLLSGKYDAVFGEIADKQQAVMKEQYELLINYLKENGIYSSKIGLINNSINGNGQLLLEKVLERENVNSKCLGLQFVKSRKCRQRLGERCRAWITDEKLPSYYTMSFNHFALLFEHLMFEASGTALCFERTQNGVAVICEQQRKEKENNEVVNRVQKYAIQFVREYSQMCPGEVGDKAVRFLMQLVRYPFYEDAVLIGNLYDDDVTKDARLVDVSIDKGLSLKDKVRTSKDYNYVKWQQGYLTMVNVPSKIILCINLEVTLKDICKSVGSKIKGLLS